MSSEKPHFVRRHLTGQQTFSQRVDVAVKVVLRQLIYQGEELGCVVRLLSIPIIFVAEKSEHCLVRYGSDIAQARVLKLARHLWL